MKKLFLGMSLLAVAGLWTGCSNDDETINVSNDTNAISFRAQGGTPTLRTVGTTTNDVDAFVVWGSDNVSYSNFENIFDGITVARQAGGGYDYNPKQYYGVGATVADFVAYSPVASKITLPYFSFFPTVTLSTASFTYEVVAPDATGNKTQEDLLIAGTRVAPSAGIPVSLNFQHALSRIFVQAHSELSETVTIKGLTLKNLFSKGRIYGASTDVTMWRWYWTGYSRVDYSYILAPTGVAVKPNTTYPTLVTSMEQGMIVLPQDLININNDQVFDANDFALEVNYDLANLEDQVAYVLLPNNYELEMGKQYVITVNFNSTVTNMIEINFDIDVTPWEYQLIDPLAP